MTRTAAEESDQELLMPRYITSAFAFISAIAIALISILGPLALGAIHYRTSQSGIWQTQGGDLANLVLLVPILLLGGALHLMRKEGAKFFLILPLIALIYTGMMLGIGQEWGNPEYTGNVEQYAWLFLLAVIGGLMLLVASLPMFTEKDAPEFNRRSLRAYVSLMALLLLLFAAMWLSELAQVIRTGDTASGSYRETPVVRWKVRYLDLGITIPPGFLSLALLLTKPKKAYPLILLFFGFFITMGTSVATMGSSCTSTTILRSSLERSQSSRSWRRCHMPACSFS